MMHLAGIDENWSQIGLFVYECWEGAVKTMPHGLAEWINNTHRNQGARSSSSSTEPDKERRTR